MLTCLNRYLTNNFRYLTDTYQYLLIFNTYVIITPYLTDHLPYAEVILANFLIQINIYQYLRVTYQYLINAYIIKAIFD